MNIYWLASNCALTKKWRDAAAACDLLEIINMPTRININRQGSLSPTCIDHCFTNAPKKCSKAVSVPVGFSDHNIIALKIKTTESYTYIKHSLKKNL